VPADRETFVQPGRLGVNYSQHPVDLRDGELADAINFQIGERGSLEKRRGYSAVGAVDELGATSVLAASVFVAPNGTRWIAAYTADGSVVASSDGGVSWAAVATGLATGVTPAFTSFLGNLVWVNGTDQLHLWDGATVTSVAAAPLARYAAVWRNRLWLVGGTVTGTERRVWWSGIGSASDWTNTATNYVDLIGYGVITACTASPNVGTEASSGDGVLVFTDRSMHRIIDDTDNVAGVSAAIEGATTGGANVIVDASTGCVNHRTIAHVHGRVYLLGKDGVYSTDGHAQLRAESRNVAPVFRGGVTNLQSAVAIGYRDRYYLAFASGASGTNDRVLELYVDKTVDEHGQAAWMPHSIPAQAWLTYSSVTGDRLYFFDNRDGSLGRLRWLFNGPGDAAAADAVEDIHCEAATGAINFGVGNLKRLRRIYLLGRGVITVSVSRDFESAVSESRVFTLSRSYRSWGEGVWGSGQWGSGAAKAIGAAQYYTRRGRYFSLRFIEQSQAVGPTTRVGGVITEPAGGASIEGVTVSVVPLDSP
jgi:hypothetical protein